LFILLEGLSLRHYIQQQCVSEELPSIRVILVLHTYQEQQKEKEKAGWRTSGSIVARETKDYNFIPLRPQEVHE
jgi:hypothetical protein